MTMKMESDSNSLPLKIISEPIPIFKNPPYFDGLANDLAIQPLKNLASWQNLGIR